ncbi:dihydropteroate synthase [Nesterenkonia sp. LB17]|uniref:dihydropteroate synthase n=1 Tax=unclassified Nesterenkonia TaxID=2629769 RepID=UPI001F4D34EE|nr:MULTISPECIES: dihydropteroate synthase [unclassified Nesterenkonia]MCH8563371.1 dihydropteroate synthase [Nesterenkonia sp. YGD6]MCH8566590.1 dihydropteroate synthase [Nesterenkonia sp. LB17]MCH8571095.1 dihydropteroate synthase [Nesterenkonia sp. AY15]
MRTSIMGILNLTPDSFSDGGRFDDGAGTPDVVAAVTEALRMTQAGAALIDVGGESTRPGAQPTPLLEEQRRILPVIEELLGCGIAVSVDTRRAATARAAFECADRRGVDPRTLIINDVSGALTEPDMPELIVESGAQVVITHNRGDSQTMGSLTDYDSLLEDVIAELLAVRDRYLDAGARREQLILDPGIGFSKTPEQNWELIRSLESFVRLGHRVLFGASRKGFLAPVTSGEARDTATAVLSALAAQAGVWGVRVHDVQGSRDAVQVIDKLRS